MADPLHPLPKTLIGVSTKMYFDHPTTLSYISSLASTYASPPFPTLFIIPSFPSLIPATTLLQSTPHILLGAQDTHWEDRGAFTGSVSPLELAQIGVKIVEIGHAERRRAPWKETNEMVAWKVRAVIRNGMLPLVCIGEAQKSTSGIASEGVGKALREVLPQVEEVLEEIPAEADVVFAYEPFWAIGGLEPASGDHVKAVVSEVKRVVGGKGRKGECRVLYGGSAGPGTWEGLKGTVDGLFLGRFAHDLEKLKMVVEEVGRGRRKGGFEVESCER